MYNILVAFSIPMRLVGLIHMCLYDTYSRVRVGKHFPDIFPIKNGLKNGVALSSLLFIFSLDYAVRRIQVIQNGLKLKATYQLLSYVENVNICGGSVYTIK